MKNKLIKDLLQALFQAFWFSCLLFPFLVMKVSVVNGVASLSWRWVFLPSVFGIALILSLLWQFGKTLKAKRSSLFKVKACPVRSVFGKMSRFLQEKTIFQNKALYIFILLIIAIAYPLVVGFYSTGIVVTAMIYVLLALGLNIIVGLGGLLNLGHAAFFAVGAYSYGMLWKYMGTVFVAKGIHTGLLFWLALPLGAVMATIFGILLSLPVLRLRGDYLAIITLAFGEIVRMFLQNSTKLTGGAQGIRLIPKPWFFGIKLGIAPATTYIYYITLFFVILATVMVRRLENSRVGRALEGMREDEIACQAVGINLVKNKLITFALGSFWAGIAGVLFAARTGFINPGSFTLWESIIILMAVVIGGTGSIPGVFIGALVLKLLPEWFRPLSQYRMIIYGVAMILIIIFKADGLIPRKRKVYSLLEDGVADAK